MKATLQPPDSHHLEAAEGWLDLGNPLEDNAVPRRKRHITLIPNATKGIIYNTIQADCRTDCVLDTSWMCYGYRSDGNDFRYFQK